MSEPLVSIILVTYNAERFIAATLLSCLNQTYQNIEILVLDNASTDATLNHLHAINDPRITVYTSSKNLGPYEGLNYLLDRAHGQFVAVQDHDDLWTPEKIQKQVEYLRRHTTFIAVGTLTFYFFEQQGMLILMPNEPVTDFVDHTSLMFRNGHFRYDVTRELADEVFIRATLRLVGHLGCLQEGLTIHRIRLDKKNLSDQRTRWNMRAALEHWRLTGYRDFAGSCVFLLYSFLPTGLHWWVRKHITLRRGQWLTVEQFQDRYQFVLSPATPA